MTILLASDSIRDVDEAYGSLNAGTHTLITQYDENCNLVQHNSE